MRVLEIDCRLGVRQGHPLAAPSGEDLLHVSPLGLAPGLERCLIQLGQLCQLCSLRLGQVPAGPAVPDAAVLGRNLLVPPFFGLLAMDRGQDIPGVLRCRFRDAWRLMRQHRHIPVLAAIIVRFACRRGTQLDRMVTGIFQLTCGSARSPIVLPSTRKLSDRLDGRNQQLASNLADCNVGCRPDLRCRR